VAGIHAAGVESLEGALCGIGSGWYTKTMVNPCTLAPRFVLMASFLVGACNSALPVGETDGADGSDSAEGSGDSTSSNMPSGTSEGTTDGTGDDPVGPSEGVYIEANRDIDILFVVDNSGSMGGAQANLTEGLGGLVDTLEAPDVQANYRIGITTTDDSNYWCNGSAVSSPEAGQFVLSSCRSRLADFYFAGSDINAETACTDFCEFESIEMSPTMTQGDPTPAARPWVESVGGVTNLPAGVTATQALQCFVPQGINGCGFESHLESMWKALRLSEMSGQSQSGFIRDHAALAVVFVSDEADCSFNRDLQSIVFGEEGVGNQVFWSLPDQQQSPTSAVCWNAGVSCDFDLGSDQCRSIDLDVDGSETTDEDAAALYPISKYTSLLQEIESSKQQINPSQQVLVSAIVGVPENYPETGQLSYAPGPDATDPTSFQASFGIGPGCASQVAEAVPPVRLREFAESFLTTDDDNNLFSICSNDYTPAFQAIANSVRQELRPSCMPACVADTDPVVAGLQPQCSLVQTSIEGGSAVEENIPECDPAGSLPDGADACFIALVDADGSTATPDDDMDLTCVAEGWNLEFRLVRRAGVPAPSGAQVLAVCELSENRAVDCPGLPG